MTNPQPPTTSSRTNEEWLKLCAEREFGGSVDEMLVDASSDSIVLGICTTCEATSDSCEPDMENGQCEECEAYTLNSVLVLAKVI